MYPINNGERVLLSLVIYIIQLIILTSSASSSLFKNKSFLIKTKLIKTLPNGGDPTIIHLIEHYSYEQGRVKLEYDFDIDFSNKQEFIYDAKTNVGLSYSSSSSDKNHCSSCSLEKLYSYLFAEKSLNHLFNSIECDEDLKHVIGPSKILLLIEKYFDSFKADKKAAFDDNIDKIRNHQTVRLELNLPFDNSIRISAYFQTLPHEKESILSSNLIQVAMEFTNELSLSQIYYIDFYQLKQISSSNNIHLDDYDLVGQEEESLVEDLFAYPTGNLNCFQQLPERVSIDLFKSRDLSSVRFSFTLNGMENLNEFEYFLGFDGKSKALRMEVKHNGDDPSFTSLIDFQTNKNYLLMERTKKSFVIQTNSDYFKLSRLLTGPNQFIYMGRAKVDGIFVRVYEALGEELPIWASQPILFKDLEGKFQVKERNRLNDERKNYSIVVYMNEDKLIKIQIYHQKESVLNSKQDKELYLSARFYKFIWDLNDSMNGIKRSDLFSPEWLSTSALSPTTNYKHISMILEQDNTQLSNGKRDHSWLESSVSRNKALTYSLKDDLLMNNMLLFDLNSSHRVNKKSGKCTIFLDFRLVEHSQEMSKSISLIDEHALILNDADSLIKTVALLLFDCFNLIEAENAKTYVYLDEIKKVCYATTTSAESALTKHFQLNVSTSAASNKLYKVESLGYDSTDHSSAGFSDEKFRLLENRMMTLLEPISLSESAANNTMLFRIKRVKLVNENFVNRLTNTQIKPPATSFPGFKLPESNIIMNVKGTETIEMNRQLCHAACLENFECQSYSICHRTDGTGNECLLSSLEFKAPGIKELLSFRGTLKLARGSRVKVESDPVEVQLIRDKRCELFNKVHMDLFEKSQTTGLKKVTLNDKEVFRVLNEEVCAELCFRRNLDVIVEVAKLNKQLRTKDELVGEILETIREKFRREMAKFCDHFLYLDTSVTEKQMNLLDKLAKVYNGTVSGSGYCVLEQSSAQNNLLIQEEEEEEEIQSTLFQFDSYEFDFSILYEKRYGFRLLESPKSLPEFKAYEKISKGQGEQEEENLKIMKNFLDEGKNIQLRFILNSNNCARLCFFQTSGLWPGCQSFDAMIVHRLWDESFDSVCLLNSLSLLVNGSNDKSMIHRSKSRVQVWHYEPRFDLVRDILRENTELELMMMVNYHSNNKHYLTKSALVFIVALSFGSGLLFGLKLARNLLAHLDGVQRNIDETNAAGQTGIPMSLTAGNLEIEMDYERFIK